MKKIKIEVLRAKGKARKRFFWRVVSSNGQILLTSDLYRRRPIDIASGFYLKLKKDTADFVDNSRKEV